MIWYNKTKQNEDMEKKQIISIGISFFILVGLIIFVADKVLAVQPLYSDPDKVPDRLKLDLILEKLTFSAYTQIAILKGCGVK